MKIRIPVLSILTLVVTTTVWAESPKASWQPNSTPTDAAQTYTDIKNTLGIVPQFLKSYPQESIAGAWQELKAIQISPNTDIPPRYKELIGLAVASQIPCHYCTQFHTTFAKANGATDDQAKEAIALAASARHWSAYLNGIQLNEESFRQDVDRIMKKFRDDKNQPEATSLSSAVPLSASEAYKDIENTFDFVPEFLRKFPQVGISGAWSNLKSLELNPNTSMPPKYKSLISLAVSAQIPCQYCVYFDTESCRLAGASEQEIGEAIAMASLTRQWSTVLNGNRVDEAQFKKELAQIVEHSKKAAKAST